jgi:phosphoribosyl 1,2-cyclic phosphodiesterase
MGAAGPLRITVLGSGTSVGVPTPGCHCAVCTSADPRDNRLRPSVLLQYGGHNVVIDTTPDFRTQMLRAKVDHLDAVLFTHSHADHIMGLDDVRPFNFRQRANPHLSVGRHHERHPAPFSISPMSGGIFGPPTGTEY